MDEPSDASRKAPRPLTAEEWAAQVLPSELRSAWSDAQRVHALVLDALTLKQPGAAGPAVARLLELEPRSERARAAAALRTLALGDHAGATQQFEALLRTHPDSATAWLNLSRLEAQKGRFDAALEKARRALDLVPEHEDAFGWWQALHWKHARAGFVPALEALAAQNGRWRAKGALAEWCLAQGDLPRALALYERACADAAQPLEAVRWVSQSLLARGLEREVLSVLGPWLAVALEDPSTALRVAQSCLARGELGRAEALVEDLSRRDGVPPEALAGVREGIARERSELLASEQPLRAVPLDGPLWLIGLGRPPWLERLKPPSAAAQVVVAWATVAGDVHGAAAAAMARGLPLALTEALWARTTANPVTLLPVSGQRGWARSARPLTAEVATELAKGVPGARAVVLLHVEVERARWTGHLRVLFPELKTQAQAELEAAGAEALWTALEAQVFEVLVKAGVVRTADAPSGLLPPATARPLAYLQFLESVAGQLFAASGQLEPAAVWNEALTARRCAELLVALPGVQAPLLLGASAVVAQARYQPRQVRPLAAALLPHAAREAWAVPVAALLGCALGDDAPPGEWDEAERQWLHKVRACFARE